MPAGLELGVLKCLFMPPRTQAEGSSEAMTVNGQRMAGGLLIPEPCHAVSVPHATLKGQRSTSADGSSHGLPVRDEGWHTGVEGLKG